MSEYYFKHCGRSFPKDESDKDKYVVIACAKNEEEYIVEWIEHYLNLGFDKLFIVDNNDEGNDSLPNLLQNYVNEGKVQIFDCRGVFSVQVGLYADFCAESNFKWCAFYDCDEFLEIGAYRSVKNYLEQFNGYDIVMLNWLCFGPNKQIKKKPGGVQERFPKPVSPVLYFKENGFVKSLVRGDKEKFKDCFFNGSHTPTNCPNARRTVAGYYDTNDESHSFLHPRYKNGYIKHYYTKSFEEWLKKAGRGWPDGTDTLNLKKYFCYDERYEVSVKFMRNSVFNVDDYSLYDRFKTELADYDVIELSNNGGEFLYSYVGGTLDLMTHVTDHTFIVSEHIVDEPTYNMLLEAALLTGNRLVYAKNPYEIWETYEKYHKKNTTYYIVSFG